MIRSIQPTEHFVIRSGDETAAENTTVLEAETAVSMDIPEEVASVRQILEHIPPQGLYHVMFLCW